MRTKDRWVGTLFTLATWLLLLALSVIAKVAGYEDTAWWYLATGWFILPIIHLTTRYL